MKRFSIIIVAMLMPLLAFSQKYSTGITPYSFQQAFNHFANSQSAAGEKVLKQLGYKKFGQYNNQIGYNMVFTRACKVTMGADGFVKTAKSTGSQYASYIQVGPGVGMDWSMSLNFISTKGSTYFANLLKKVGYKYKSGHKVWVRSSSQDIIFQDGKVFSISDTVGYDDFED